MNSLLVSKDIKEMELGANFAYVLENNNYFLSTEYKVLQSQINGNFVKCMKLLYNGKVQLFYLTQELRTFSSMINTMDGDTFLNVVANLFSSIIDVKNNGFLSCQNIDISFDKIFVDSNTHKVSLVYLPVSKRLYDSYSTFENEIRTELVRLIASCPNFSSNKIMKMRMYLTDGKLTLEDVYARIKGGKTLSSSLSKNIGHSMENIQNDELHIIAMNAPTRVEILINKDDFIIGKKAESCDGVISFNKMISRTHCKINKKGLDYFITDLNSANGTFVNKIKVKANQPYPIKNGDIIRLANSDFQVSIG